MWVKNELKILSTAKQKNGKNTFMEKMCRISFVNHKICLMFENILCKESDKRFN